MVSCKAGEKSESIGRRPGMLPTISIGFDLEPLDRSGKSKGRQRLLYMIPNGV